MVRYPREAEGVVHGKGQLFFDPIPESWAVPLVDGQGAVAVHSTYAVA